MAVIGRSDAAESRSQSEEQRVCEAHKGSLPNCPQGLLTCA